MSLDLNSLPADIQAYIKAEVEKALKANEPAPPKELTPAERAALFLVSAYRAESADRSTPSGSGAVHMALFEVLAILVEAVFPKEASDTSTNGNTAVPAEVIPATSSESPNVNVSLGR
jgi:hypothetical protein